MYEDNKANARFKNAFKFGVRHPECERAASFSPSSKKREAFKRLAWFADDPSALSNPQLISSPSFARQWLQLRAPMNANSKTSKHWTSTLYASQWMTFDIRPVDKPNAKTLENRNRVRVPRQYVIAWYMVEGNRAAGG